MIFVIRNQSAPINISYESKLGSLFYNFRDFLVHLTSYLPYNILNAFVLLFNIFNASLGDEFSI